MTAAAIVGVDIGGTSVRAAKVRDGAIITRAERRIPGQAAADVVLGAERDHFIEGGADFIADHGERKAGQDHAVNLLSTAVFG